VGIWDTSIDGVFTFRCHQNWQGGKKKKLYWLVVSTPLKNMSSSLEMVIPIPTGWEIIQIPWFQSPPTSHNNR